LRTLRQPEEIRDRTQAEWDRINQKRKERDELRKRINAKRVTLNTRFLTRKISCVYFLMQGSNVVYIGQTDNLARRLGEHLDEGVKEWDVIEVVECSNKQHMDEVEQVAIQKMRPFYNVILYDKLPAPGSNDQDSLVRNPVRGSTGWGLAVRQYPLG